MWLSGAGFSPTVEHNRVRLGSVPARVVSVTPRELVVEVPQGAHSGSWNVSVEGSGEARTSNPFMLTVRPRIVSFEPREGAQGGRVTVRVQNVPETLALVQVRLQGVDCPVESVSAGAIVVTLPPGLQAAPARFEVIVRLQGTGRAEQDFAVLIPSRIVSIEPSSAPVGARVTVRGEGFETDARRLRVRLGAVNVRPVSVTATAIEFVVPPRARSGAVTVQGPGRQVATGAFEVGSASSGPL